MMKIREASFWIEKLELLAHPEGGWFKEVYRSAEEIPLTGLPKQFSGSRSISTSIYYLLEQGQFSAFHRIQSDETWHFYAGAPIHIHCINEQGRHYIEILGNDPEKGEKLQLVIPAGCWFGSVSIGAYSLAGCTVAPGFDFEDFVMADRDDMLVKYPDSKEIILKLTR